MKIGSQIENSKKLELLINLGKDLSARKKIKQLNGLYEEIGQLIENGAAPDLLLPWMQSREDDLIVCALRSIEYSGSIASGLLVYMPDFLSSPNWEVRYYVAMAFEQAATMSNNEHRAIMAKLSKDSDIRVSRIASGWLFRSEHGKGQG